MLINRCLSRNTLQKQECIPVGCVPSAAVAAGGCASQHALGWGCLPGGCLPRGACLGGVCPEGVCPGGGCVCLAGGCLYYTSQTPVKILPCRNYVTDANNYLAGMVTHWSRVCNASIWRNPWVLKRP